MAVAGVLVLSVSTTPPAAAGPGTWLSRLNGYRAQHGLAPLAEDPATSVVAQSWTATMAAGNNLHHNPRLAQEVTTPWTRIAENVGYAGDEATLFQLFVKSTTHRENILGAYNAVGIGEVFSGGRLWTTHVFLMTNAVLEPPCPGGSNATTAPGVVSNAPEGQPTYLPLTPARLMDSRPGQQTIDGLATGGGALGRCASRSLVVTGRAGVPASGVGAVVLNVTAAAPTAGSFLTVFPAGAARPNASNLNFGPGQTIANTVVATVGTNGQVSIYNDQGSTHVVVDVAGWFPTVSDYNAVLPARLMDSRGAGTGPLGPGATHSLAVTGRAGLPAWGVGAVVLNVTATGPTTGGFLTAFPAGAARPNASNLNFGPGQTIANTVIAKVSSDGWVSIYNDQGSTHVIVDVAGWFPAASDYNAVPLARLMDSRPARTIDGMFSGIGPLGPGATQWLRVTGRAGLPAWGVGAVVLNITATGPTSGSYLTVFPSGAARPNTSNLNFEPGQTIANTVVAKVGSDGWVSIYNSLGSTHVIVDIAGWFPV